MRGGYDLTNLAREWFVTLQAMLPEPPACYSNAHRPDTLSEPGHDNTPETLAELCAKPIAELDAALERDLQGGPNASYWDDAFRTIGV